MLLTDCKNWANRGIAVLEMKLLKTGQKKYFSGVN